MITEQDRHELYVQLEQVLGTEEASTLMAHLPPVGWADVATKQDLEFHAAATKQDFEFHAANMKQDLEFHAAATKQDLLATKLELTHRLDAVETKVDRQMLEMRVELAGILQRQFMWLTGIMIPGFVATWAAILATR